MGRGWQQDVSPAGMRRGRAARCYKFSKTFSKTIDRAGIKLPAAGILQITVCKEVLEDAGFKGK